MKKKADITKLLRDEEALLAYLEQDPTYLIPKVGEICLPVLVKLLMNNKFGDPLELEPFQCVILRILWEKKFPMILLCRGGSKTFILAVYSILRALLVPGSKIVIVGGGFRQSKLVFGYIEEIVRASPIIQESIKNDNSERQAKVKYATDMVSLRVGINSNIVGVPCGDGSKIRGIRASTLIVDEAASINESVFDEAIAPFLSVRTNPAQAAKIERIAKRLISLGVNPKIISYIRDNQVEGNQLIMSGTASYEFNHFYRRYLMYKLFTKSKGDIRFIKQALEMNSAKFGSAAKTEYSTLELEKYAKSWSDYAIVELPYYALPPGFLDESIISSHKVIMNPVVFGQEYECKFSKDTFGFFPRSLIHQATPSKGDIDEVHYEIFGDPGFRYVMGIDPARWNDNFAVVILKLDGPKAKVVYCESWRRSDWPTSIRRVRELIKRFNIVHMAIDQGGGGDHFSDLLANATYIDEDEYPITRFNDDDHKLIPNRVDLVELVNFNTWSIEANYALHADIQTKRLLFPGRIDEDVIFTQSIKVLGIQDKKEDELNLFKFNLMDMIHGTYDSNDNLKTFGVVREVDSMIDEICTIEVNVTEKGTETFGLPRLSDQPEGLDIRRRDRYSALLLADYAARQKRGTGFQPKVMMPIGGTVEQIVNKMYGRSNYNGPRVIGGVLIP